MKTSYLHFLFALCILFLFTSCGNSKNGDLEVKLIPVKIGSSFGYIDREGKIVINPQFGDATVFREGLALVETTGDNPKWGFISEDGKYAINPIYKQATVFSEGLAWVVAENAAPAAINTKGEVKFTLPNAQDVSLFKNGMAIFSVNDSNGLKWGFVDKEGNVKIKPQFTDVNSFHEGKSPVENENNKWGYINENGKLIINYQFDKAGFFINGRAGVVSDDKAGLIDESGKYVINPQYTSLSIDGDRLLINQDDKYGWCDMNGKMIINPQFSKCSRFYGNDLTPVQVGKSFGYINREGKIIINPQFDVAASFNGNLAPVETGGKVGFIDKQGKYVINPQFDAVPEDLVYYMQNAEYSADDMVESDYFNVGEITSKINLNRPEGLTFNNTISQVLTHLNKSAKDFDEGNEKHLLLKDKPMVNGVVYDFFVAGNLFKDVRDGNFRHDVLNPDAKVNEFNYMIVLSEQATGKEKEVEEAFEKSLAGYTKDESASNEQFATYKNATQKITFSTEDNKIYIIIKAIQPAS